MAVSPFGFWMNRRGRLVPIVEHGRAVIERPRRFGLTKAIVADLVGHDAAAYNPQDRSPDTPRARLYRMVMDHGWIRIRGGHRAWSIQFAGDAAQAAHLIMAHLAPEYWGPASTICFEDLATGQRLCGCPADLVAVSQGDEWGSQT